MAAKARSKVLQDDRLIYQLTESIDSVKHYFPLGRDLLGSQAAVSNIIGRTEPDFQEIVFKCLYTWRNANRKGAGAKLVEIFRGVELDKVATSLEQELQRRPNCLSEDVYLQSLASKLDCASVYRKLGLPLLENNSVKFSNLIGPVNIPFAQYQDALFHVLIKWRNQAGSSIASLEELKQTFLRHGLINTAQMLHCMEYGSNASPMDIPSRTEEIDTDGPPRHTGRPLSQQEFFDIYLLASSKETPYFLKMKNIIQRNSWRMTTPFESKLGVPVLESIEEAVLNCSHVVYLITKEDCESKDANHTMTIEMAFQSLTDKGLGGRVIPVFCCDMSFVPLKLRTLTGVNIRDEALEERLRNSIDVDIRKEREEEYRSVSELSTIADDDEPLPLISSSMATGQ